MTAGGEKGTDLIGTVIKERYKVLRLLGEGGMGGVYECEHVEVGKHVAVKFVSAVHAQSPQIAARLKREARSTGALESDHIVQVFDAGEDPVHGLFLVMELLRGKDLAVLLEGGKRVSVLDASLIAFQAALGLERAHDAGIIHRDLKPANVFVCEKQDGRAVVKLVDFGIAKLVRDANEEGLDPGITRAGAVLGTPQYMSPEQAQGLDTLDLRTDVYSLGAVVFELITGEAPHPNMPTYEQTILRIVMSDAPRLSQKIADVSRDLDDLVASMLARDPNGRPPHMRAVRAALTRMFPDLEQRNLPFAQLAIIPTNDRGSLAQPAATVVLPPSAPPPGPAMRPLAPSYSNAPGVTGAQAVTGAPHNSWPPQQVSPRTSAGVSFESRTEPSGNGSRAAFAIVGAIVLVLLLLGGGGVWLARAKLKSVLASQGAAAATSAMTTTTDVLVPTAVPSENAVPGAVGSASASAAPVASVAAQTSATTAGTPSALAGSGKTQRPPTTSGKNPPPPSSAKPHDRQLGGTGLTDNF